MLEGVQKIGDLAVSGGGFADVYEGTYKNQKIAIKVIRVFVTGENWKRVYEVSSIHIFYSLFHGRC
jgi:hypothetical protein